MLIHKIILGQKAVPNRIDRTEQERESQVILRVENLSKIYDSKGGSVVALSNINLTVKKGRIYPIKVFHES